MTSKITFYLILPFLMFGCASTSSVVFDYNLDIDFNNYNTYVLCVEDLFVENANYPNRDNEYLRQLIGDALELEMEERAHSTNVLNPQLQVGFKIVIKEEQVSFNNCEHSGELEYWENCKVHNQTYHQETLVTYVSDYTTNKVLWQASIDCSMNKSRKKLKSYVEGIVSQLFDTYPKDITTP